MTTYLIYDTETSGFLPKKNVEMPREKQPWIVQMGILLTDGKTDFHRMAIMIDADGRSINPGAQKVHGISVKHTEKGMSEFNALIILADMIHKADKIVCHNAAFDIPMTILAFNRAGLALCATELSEKENICTMKSTTDYCMIPGKYKNFKWPKLEELHQKLFGFKPPAEDLHDALADVEYTKKCFFELLAREII